jgi:hypothetical protein
MSNFKVFKLTGIACKSQLISCSSAEPDAWVSFADHCQEVAFLKMEIERLVSAGEDLSYAVRSKHGIDFALEEWDKVANSEGKQS